MYKDACWYLRLALLLKRLYIRRNKTLALAALGPEVAIELSQVKQGVLKYLQ